MSPLQPPSASCAEGHCVTCSDEAVPMTVVRVEVQSGLALCADAAGVRHTVETSLVESLAAGERVLVHAGVAIAPLAAEVGV